MNGSNSDWLDDTIPTDKDNTNTIEENNNTTEDEMVNNDPSEIENNVEEIQEQKEDKNVQIETDEPRQSIKNQTLSGMVEKVEEEELSEDEKLLMDFIGPNAEKFSYKIISFPGLFFTSLYMLYRKMYLLGFITLIIQSAIVIFVNPYVALIINVLTCLFFNSLYISHAKRKIENVKHTSGSKEFGYVSNMCAEKGGVNKGIVLLGFILEFAILIAAILFLPVNKTLQGAKDLINSYTSEMGIDLEDF